ncbi:hypothetical protein KIW84_043091 [Lathyrus oleraceus]|uniref:Uncharacterized protein n=1 Tax=Pisum sativum TaxID=3888 RepID=A0A9D4XEQ4_PEA|nr:hypothetical protein KIW84_043091 [Pisum sativum]
MDVPEKILCQSHVQPGPVADFLHENVLDFLNDEAVEDAWILSSYLGDADILLAKLRGMLSSYNEAESILQSAAASIAVRGVLFGNSQPISSRWHAIRRPKLWQVQKESSYHKVKTHYGSSCNVLLSCDVAISISFMATEYIPMFKLLGDRVGSGYNELDQESVQNMDMEDFDTDKMSLDGEAMEISDDDIEDW